MIWITYEINEKLSEKFGNFIIKKFFMKKTILLTGWSGFIGRNIRESYLWKKYNIIAPTHGDLDIASTDFVDDFFIGKYFDIVLHTAVKPYHRAATDRSNLLYTNLRMFENLERNCDRFGKFINFGSWAIYDVAKNNSGVSEDDIYKNMGVDELSFTKYIIQKQIDNLPNFINLNIFGIFWKYEEYSIRFISNAITKTLFKLPITLRQNRRFSYLYIDDLMPIIEWFIENEPKFKSYNIVPDDYVELKNIAYTIANFAGGNDVKIANDWYWLDYYGSNARLKNEYNDVKFTPINDAIMDLYDYYTKNINLINKELLLFDK